MKKFLAMLLALSMLGSLALTGCGEDKEDKEEGIKSIALIVQNLGDKSFNDISWDGVKKFGADHNIEVKALEYGTDKTKMQPTLLDAADNYDVMLFGTNEILEYAANGIADDNPDKYFIGYDIGPDYKVEDDNIMCINFKQNEGDFLAAVMAQRISKTGNIGFVGGGENTVILDFMVGYIDGSLYANPNGKVAASFVGNWNDTAKAKELSLVQIEQSNVDVLHQVAGGAGLGLFEACKEKGCWAIGVDADQRQYFTESNPELAKAIFTSMLKRVDIAAYDVLEKTLDGTAKYGTLQRWGAAEGVTVLVTDDYFKEVVGEDAAKEYDELLKGINDREIHSAFYMEQSEINDLRNSVKP